MKYMLLIMGFRKGEGMPQPPSSGAPSAEEFMQYQQELGQAGVRVDSAVLHWSENKTLAGRASASGGASAPPDSGLRVSRLRSGAGCCRG